MEQITAKAATLSTSQIKEGLMLLKDNLSNEADCVTEVLLELLETRLPEHEFLAYCETL